MSASHTLPAPLALASALKEWRFPVEGMTCGSCVARVEKKKSPGRYAGR